LVTLTFAAAAAAENPAEENRIAPTETDTESQLSIEKFWGSGKGFGYGCDISCSPPTPKVLGID